MFCLECGEVIPDGSDTCPKCGVDIIKKSNQAIVYATKEEPDISKIVTPQKKVPSKVSVGIIAAVCVFACIVIVCCISMASLKKSLVKEWYDTDGLIIKVLDIDDDKIEYRLETGYSWLDTSLAHYDWKPAGWNKIKIKRSGNEYEIFTIEFNDEKNMFTISPAITSVDKSERWYHVDF